MRVRQAENRDEVWLLDKLESEGVEDKGFRSRDYVIAISPKDGEECAAGRIRYRKRDDEGEETLGELDNFVTFDGYQGPAPFPDILRALADKAAEEDVSTLYHSSPPSSIESMGGEYVEGDQFGVDDTVLRFDVDSLIDAEDDPDSVEALAEEFGYDEDTTTKYSID